MKLRIDWGTERKDKWEIRRIDTRSPYWSQFIPNSRFRFIIVRIRYTWGIYDWTRGEASPYVWNVAQVIYKRKTIYGKSQEQERKEQEEFERQCLEYYEAHKGEIKAHDRQTVQIRFP